MENLNANETIKYLESTLTIANEGIVLVDHDGIILRVNPVLLKILGYEENELLGKPFYNLAVKDQVVQKNTTKIPLYRFYATVKTSMEYTFFHKQGHNVPIRFRAAVIKDEHGEATGAVGILEPIVELTEIDGAEDSLAEKMWEAQQNFDNILENSADAIVICDSNGNIMMANKAFLFLLDYTEKEVIGRHISEFSAYAEGTYASTTGEKIIVNKEFTEKNALKAAELFEKGYVSNWETYLVKKEKVHVPTDITMSVLKGKDGERRGSVVIVRDITERRMVENEAKKTKDYLENIFDTSLEGIITMDAMGVITMANKSMEEMLGYSSGELIGKYSSELAYKENGYDKLGVELLERLFDKGSVSGFEHVWPSKDGTLIDVEINAVLLYDDGGNNVGSVTTVRDITARKKIEIELIKAKDSLNNIIESSLDSIVVSDKKGLVVRANKSFQDLISCREEEIIGKHMSELSPTEEGTYETTTGVIVQINNDFFSKSMAMISEMNEEGKIVNWVSYLIRKDKKVIPVEQNIIYFCDENGERTGAVGIIRDITERQKAEQELIKAKEAAEEADRSKSAFLANMSHEIRTPMNGVIGFADMMLDTSLDDEQKDYANTIKRSGDSLLSLINDILDFSKIEAGKIDIEEMDFDMEVLACDVCELIRPRLAEKDVEILFRIGDNLPAWVKGDPHRFKQVLVNLMGNAVKFIEKGEIELSLDVEKEEARGIMVHAKVRDTGIGIPEDKLDSIFEMFQQADEGITRKYGGTGLGLSICRKIAELMGGNVWAESEAGKGSIFHFTAHLKKPGRKQVKRFAPVALSGKKVLITDDNKSNLDILTNLLESAGMRVARCENGEETLSAFINANEAGDPFDIAILDIMMPGMSGYELAQKISSTAGDKLPLLAFSSSIGREADKCREAGFNGFLPKPINRINLFKMIERLLAKGEDRYLQEESKTKILTQYSVREDTKHSISILLAEDNPVNQKLAEKLLTKAGYRVDIAGNGQEAVDKFAASPEKYDLILMDVQMPELNGLDATKMLRDKGFKQIPIVAMTANAMKGDREKCLASGMNDYISKPIKREVVFEVLRKWVIDKTLLN